MKEICFCFKRNTKLLNKYLKKYHCDFSKTHMSITTDGVIVNDLHRVS